jgi:signal transduction histidine kinase
MNQVYQPDYQPAPLLAALVHEVRNPLTTIDLSLEMLRSVVEDKELRALLDMIGRSSIRINSLVNDVLTGGSDADDQQEKYSIYRLLDEVLEMGNDRIILKNVKVTKAYLAPDRNLVLDRPKVKIALTNILINAIEAMPSGKGDLKVILHANDNKYIVCIEDNGCGISRQNLPYIFKPYYSGKTGGLGLGLFTTLEILQAGHIRVDVESEEGQGTRFILYFNY